MADSGLNLNIYDGSRQHLLSIFVKAQSPMFCGSPECTPDTTLRYNI